LYVFVC
jgi:hypothetical protein